MPLFFPLLLSFIGAQVRPTVDTITNFLSWAPRVAVARLLAKWRSLLTIIIGVVLGAGIGALIPLYSNAVGQIGMVQRLEMEPAADAHSQLRISLTPANFDNLDGRVSFVQTFVAEAVERHLGQGDLENWVQDINPYIRTTKMGLLDESGEAITSTRTSLLYIEDWSGQVRVIEGVLPGAAPVPDDAAFNVAVSLTIANELGISPGDLLTVDQRLSNDGRLNPGAHASSRPFVVHVAGIIAPDDDEAPFWMTLDAQEDPLAINSGGLWQREIVLFADEPAVRDVILNYAPATNATFGWRIIYDHANLSYTHIDQATQALARFETELTRSLSRESLGLDLGYRYHTQLVAFNITDQTVDRGILQDYAAKQSVNEVPFALLLCQVGLLVIFFLVVTAALVRRGERREVAMFQSRGAWDGHILALRSIEALLICIFGALVAPFLAQRLLILLGPTIANTSDFPLPLTTNVFAFSFLASGVTFVALTATLIPVLRLPLISGGGTALRSAKVSWFQKYYVDVILAVVGLALLAMLLSRESPLIQTNLGEQRVDFFLLAAPAFLMFGLGSVALRAFPLAASAVAAISARSRGLLNALATWQLSREPIHYGRITFLLALAIGIGWFATSFRATVRRSQVDQAQYLVGADVRLYERDTAVRADRVQPPDFYLTHPDVEAASSAHRVPNITFVNNTGLQRLDMLAIDPTSLGEVAVENWRSDLGNIVVPYGPQAAVDVPQVGAPLPFAPAKIGMWVRLDRLSSPIGEPFYLPDLGRLTQRVTLHARLLDADGTWLNVPFSLQRAEYERRGADTPGFGAASYNTTGWAYYEADLTGLSYTPVGETRLVSLFWEHRTNNVNGERAIRMLFADFTLFDAEGQPAPYNLLEAGDWSFVDDSGARAEVAGLRPANPAQNNLGQRTQTLLVDFNQFALWSRMGVNLNYPAPQPLEAVVSTSLADLIGLEIDPATGLASEPVNFTLDNVKNVPVALHTQRATSYFPTLYDDRKAFVIVDLRELLFVLNQRPSATVYPDEMWLNIADEARTKSQTTALLTDLREQGTGRFSQVNDISYAEEFDQLETDPLALGLLGLMFLAFIIALALSIVGLVTYAALTAQTRRGEFGVLRALGLPAGRVVWSLLMEQGFVVLVAAVLGAGLGYVLSEAVVPTLALGTTGEGVVPPFITETEWSAIGNFALIMAGVLLTVFVLTFALVRQLSLSRTLRLGEE